MKHKLLLLSVVVLQGCAVVAEYPIATASLAVMGATGKGPADHALSYAAERDCNTLRLVEGRKICQDIEKETVLAVAIKPDHSAVIIAQANDVFAQRARINRP
jgi:hypothetical protein